MRSAEFQTDIKSARNLLGQLTQNNYEDIAKYRTIQLAIEQELNDEPGYKNIDFVLSEIVDEYEAADLDNLELPPQMSLEEIHEEYSKKMREEIEAYGIMVELLNPKRLYTEIEKQEVRKDENGNIKIEDMYEAAERNFQVVSEALEKSI